MLIKIHIKKMSINHDPQMNHKININYVDSCSTL